MLNAIKGLEVVAPFDKISMDLCDADPNVIILTADLQPYVDIFRVPKEKPKQFQLLINM